MLAAEMPPSVLRSFPPLSACHNPRPWTSASPYTTELNAQTSGLERNSMSNPVNGDGEHAVPERFIRCLTNHRIFTVRTTYLT